MSKTPVPSLSTKGLLTEPYDKADSIMADWFVTNASQSNIYQGQLSSLAALIQKATGNPDLLKSSITSQLTTLFNRYFDSTTVECTIKTNDSSTDNRFELQVVVNFNQDGTTYNIGRLGSIVDSKLINVMALASN